MTASEVLRSKPMQMATENLRAKYMKEWLSTETAEGRELLHVKAQMVDDFIGDLVEQISASKSER